MNLPATLSATDRFALVIKGLCAAVAARIASRVITGDLITLICTRLWRIETRIRALAALVRAGTPPVRRSFSRRFAGRRAPSSPSLPRGFGWLLALVPYEAACFAGQLRHVLAEPEMATLIATTPQIARTLRPLCRMLGICPDVLSPPQAATPLVTTPPAQRPPPPEPHEPPPPACKPEPAQSARAGPVPWSLESWLGIA